MSIFDSPRVKWVYTQVNSAKEQERPPNLSQYDTSSLKPKQEQRGSKTLQKWKKTENSKVLLKLHYGSKLPLKRPLKVARKSMVKLSSSRTTKEHRNEYKGKN